MAQLTLSAVSVNTDDRGVATLALTRAEKHNAFDDAVIAQLLEALALLEQSDAVRVVVLRAEGKNFSAGADLNWMRDNAKKDLAQNVADAQQLALLMHKLDTLTKPVIALVQGAAFGGALGLISCVDIALAEQNASFCLSEVKIGLIPSVISPYVIRAIGERACRRYFLTAERFFADTALSLGLLHEVVSPGELDVTAAPIINALLANSPQAVGQAKRLIDAVYNHPLSQALRDDTANRIATIRVSAEGQEGLTAFLEKRQPAWQTQG